MKISTKGRYALVIMLDLAKNYNSGKYITLKEISEKENISLKYLEKIIINLKKEDYFLTNVGVCGGYKLKYSPSEYKIGDILKASEGSLDITDCVSKDKICPNKHKCMTFPLWNELNELINNYLDSKTLEDYIGEDL